ncbi:hypothetical protein P3T73_01690 [Kiritimatiellota bacterium B12222]|nr:hypothetical protein P3T73_01690 [Kiritimatiellota bacterium B12222]
MAYLFWFRVHDFIPLACAMSGLFSATSSLFIPKLKPKSLPFLCFLPVENIPSELLRSSSSRPNISLSKLSIHPLHSSVRFPALLVAAFPLAHSKCDQQIHAQFTSKHLVSTY